MILLLLKVWPSGSLEEEVQTLLKNWEMEFFHKADIREYRSMDPEKYTFSLNGITFLADKIYIINSIQLEIKVICILAY